MTLGKQGSIKEKPHHRVEVKSFLVPFSELPRPVYWFNDAFGAGTWSGRHRHDNWGELAFMQRGYMVVCTAQGNFLVPPQRAVWIPPGQEHEWYIPQPSIDNGLYILPDLLPDMPRFKTVHTLEVTPLMREIILALVEYDQAYQPGPVSRLVDVLLDQIATLPVATHPMIMPEDHRLVELSTLLISSPDLQNSVREWCEQLGMSERTLARLFQRQTGASFGKWRQHIRLHHARNLLQSGESVTNVALECGYQSVSSFISLFKKMFGQTPGQFLKELGRK